MDTLDYDFFLDLLKKNGTWLDETHFCFVDDPEQMERWLGCIPRYDKPYWIGGCDISGGVSYHTAEEMMEAPVFGGKSLRERWAQVRIFGAMGLGLEDWYEIFLGYGDGPSPRSGPEG